MKNATYFKLLSIISFVTFSVAMTFASAVVGTRFNGQLQFSLGLTVVFGAVGIWLEARGNGVASGSRRKRKKDADDTQLDA
ncbi:MAG: hypothetical protein AAF267_09590 [Deinococcota bacterium]